MKLEKLKSAHPLPKGLEDVWSLGIPHPSEERVVLQLQRISKAYMHHLYNEHEGEAPVGVPQYFAVESDEDGDRTLLVYPPPAQEVTVVGEYIERKKL